MTPHRDLSKADRAARLFYYRQSRANGTPTLAAWVGALRELHFRSTLSASVKAFKKRSRAARKGHATRRANRS